jgi:hypothetical protein
MTTITLAERKASLLRQIEVLKRSIDLLNWPEYKEMALRYYTGSRETLYINRN